MIVRPAYINQLRSFINKPLIKIITGIRRSGKSTVLSLFKTYLLKSCIKEEQIVSINFESFAYSDLTTAKSLYEYVGKKIDRSQKYLPFVRLKSRRLLVGKRQ